MSRRFGNECFTRPDGSLDCSSFIIDGRSFFEARARAEAKALEDAIRRQGGGGPQEIPGYVAPPSSNRGVVLVGALAAIAAAAWFLSR